jgi:polyisoprenoid-binding protein YceI
VIDARRLRVVDPGRSAKDRESLRARMLGPDVLDVKRHQWITFHSITIEPLEKGAWLVNGELELHGNIRALPVRVARENGRYQGSVTVRQSDFGITPISIASGAVTVKDEVTIEFNILVTDRPAF